MIEQSVQLFAARGAPGAFAEGFVLLNFGAFIVAFHNVWGGPAAVLTAIGWGQLFKAFVRFLAPQFSVRMMQRMSVERALHFQVGGAFSLVVSLLALSAELTAQRITAAPEKTVLFVCEHGTVKSFLAKVLFEEYAKEAGLNIVAAAGARVPRAKWDSLPSVSEHFARGRAAIKVRVQQLVDTLKRSDRKSKT